jgi:hypothetical protein
MPAIGKDNGNTRCFLLSSNRLRCKCGSFFSKAKLLLARGKDAALADLLYYLHSKLAASSGSP